MFGSRKPPPPDPAAKIRLTKLTAAPTREQLQAMLDQARDNQPREVDQTWSAAGTGKTFSLLVKQEKGQHPFWTLWEDNGRESKIVWQQDTIDFALLNDVLCMADTTRAADNSRVNMPAQAPVHQTPAQAPVQQPPVQQPPAHQPPVQQPPAHQTAPQQSYSQLQPAQPYAFPQQATPKPALPYQSQQGMPATQPPPSPYQSQQGMAPMHQTAPHQSQQGMQATPAPFQPSAAQGYPDSESAAQQSLSRQGVQGIQAAQGVQALSTFGNGNDPGSVLVRAARAVSGTAAESLRAGASAGSVEGTLRKMPMSTLLQSLGVSQLTGRIEILGEDAIGEIYVNEGVPTYAHVSGILGDSAVRELVTWQHGDFSFHPNERTDVRNVHKRMETTIMEGISLLDKKKHLEGAGLNTEALLSKMHKKLSDSEIRVMLTKGEEIDLNLQIEVYRQIGSKYTLTDLLRDRPMETADWIPILFNFLTCGLIEIKPPDSVKTGALDFLGEAQQSVQGIHNSMLRPETGIYTFQAFLFFLQHEFYRFEAYGWPMSLILFEMNKRREFAVGRKEEGPKSGVLDLLPPQAVAVAARRIELVKRPLDILGHYEALEYALLLPNTRGSSAAFVANRILQALTVTPLGQNLEKKTLQLAFGVATLPNDGENLESLLTAARTAKEKAIEGTFPIVLSRTLK